MQPLSSEAWEHLADQVTQAMVQHPITNWGPDHCSLEWSIMLRLSALYALSRPREAEPRFAPFWPDRYGSPEHRWCAAAMADMLLAGAESDDLWIKTYRLGHGQLGMNLVHALNLFTWKKSTNYYEIQLEPWLIRLQSAVVGDQELAMCHQDYYVSNWLSDLAMSLWSVRHGFYWRGPLAPEREMQRYKMSRGSDAQLQPRYAFSYAFP
jgi:hypothetical protein